MNPQSPDNEELLSGMLDGELSGSDARRLESAMKEDPSLQNRLDELSAMRSSLLRGRPTGRLSKSFAANVVAVAQQRAASMGPEAPEWVLAPEPARSYTPGMKPKLDLPLGQRLLIPLGALASACAIALFALFAMPKPEPQQFAELPPFSDSPATVEPSLANDASTPNDTTTPASRSEGLASNPSPSNPGTSSSGAQDANSGEMVEGSLPADPGLKALADQPRSELASAESKMLADNSPELANANSLDAQASKLIDKSATASVVPSTDPSNPSIASSVENNSETNRLPFMLMVVTVSMDKVARENNSLNRILNEHGIASIEDLALNSDQLDALLSTGMAGSVSQSGAGVYFLKGYAKSLAGALDDICSQYKDFPEFGLNIAMDDSARSLIDQLDGIQVAANKGVAKRLGANTPNGVVTSFSPGAKRSAPFKGKQREDFRFQFQSTTPKSDLNPISHLLLIVRDAE